MKVINVLLFKLGERVHLVFRIVSNMFLWQKFDLAFKKNFSFFGQRLISVTIAPAGWTTLEVCR
jgi:hypothetical protein